MAAELLVEVLKDIDWDLIELDGPKDIMKKILTQAQKETKDKKQDPGQSQADGKKLGHFNDKHIGKPKPWNGEKEDEFKAWSEQFTTFMANAGDKKWRKILKTIQTKEKKDNLEDIDEVKNIFKDVGIDEDLAEDMLEILYDQLTQYTTGELLADVRMIGPMGSMESYRKAYKYGKKKTAENVHRARNRVSRPDIAEKVGDLEEKFRKWKKDIAYLKDIEAYDYGDAGMVSILLDMIPDETHREITAKHETVGSTAASLKDMMIEVERIIEREKDRKQSREDRKPETRSKKLGYAGQEPQQPCHEHYEEQMYVWDSEANYGYGGFIMAAKRVREEDDDEEGENGPKAKRERTQPAEQEGQGPKGKGKGKGG